jgi:hypothetical protein
MRGLSLTEPFATLISIRVKRFETRSFSTAYRGPLAIQAAKRFPPECRALVHTEPFRSALCAPVWRLGGILAVVDLVDCVRITAENAPDGDEFDFGDYTPGRFMWRLENVRRLPVPIACKGALGLWAVPADVLALIRAGLAGEVLPAPTNETGRLF